MQKADGARAKPTLLMQGAASGALGAVRGASDHRGSALLGAFVLAAVLCVSAAHADPGGGLRQQAAALRAEEHAAVLAVYGLNSQLDRARAELDDLRGRLADLRRQEHTARQELRLARQTLLVAQRRLGHTLSAIYQAGPTDPIAVIFGSTSLTEAIDGLDSLRRVAASDSAVAAQARVARRRIAGVARSLRARRAESQRLEAAAQAKTAELESTRTEKENYIARVRSESAALADRIVQVEAAARAAEARARAIDSTVAATPTSVPALAAPAPAPAPAAPQTSPPPPPAPPPAEPAPIQAPPSGARTMTVTATAYSGGGTTATGIPVGYGIVAVDPSVIPLGTRMTIPGYGEGVAADTGPGVNGAWVDVWLPTEAQAEAWGMKTLTITLH